MRFYPVGILEPFKGPFLIYLGRPEEKAGGSKHGKRWMSKANKPEAKRGELASGKDKDGAATPQNKTCQVLGNWSGETFICVVFKYLFLIHAAHSHFYLIGESNFVIIFKTHF